MLLRYPLSSPMRRGLGSPLNSSKSLGRPPFYPEIISHHDGVVINDTLLRNKALTLGNFPFQMANAACLELNGVDEYVPLDTAIELSGDCSVSVEFNKQVSVGNNGIIGGLTASEFLIWVKPSGAIEVYIDGNAYEYTNILIVADEDYDITWERVGDQGTLTFNGVFETLTVITDDIIIRDIGRYTSFYFEGRVWNFRFKDSTKNIHLRCAETSPTATHIFSDDGLYSGEIVTTDLATVRTGRQNSYFGNARYGWYEKAADDIKYPYPVSGYITQHPGNTWGYSENGVKFIEEPVGNFDGVDTLTLYEDHGTLDSDEGDAGVSYVHPTVSATAGWARALTFSDGTIIPLDEGEGTDIHKTMPDLVDAYEFATFGASGSTPDNIAIRVFGSDSVANRRYLPSIDINVVVQSYDGIDIGIVDPTALVNFYCYDNSLTGSIPDLSDNTALVTFYCYSNSLTGSIPDLSNNTALVTFRCYNNSLTGSIPDLSNNTALVNFQCNSNSLTGSIPDLSNNTALVTFQCNSNSLTGSIPDLSDNTALVTFYCNDNSLTGSIPDLSNNTALVNFYCNDNSLTDYTGGATLVFLSALNFNALNNALTETAINNLLVDFDNGTLVVASTINLTGGTNAAPTGAGATAKASLIAKGHNVTTN